MQKLLFTLLLLISFIYLSKADKGTWKTYNYNEHNFQISFHSEPEFSTDSTEYEEGMARHHYWTLDVEDTTSPNSYYFLSKSVYPNSYIHSDSSYKLIDVFLNSAVTSFLEDPNITLLSADMIEKNSYMGKSFRLQNAETEEHIVVRVYLIQNALYQLIVYTKPEYTHQTITNSFFDSFIINKLKAGNYKVETPKYDSTYSIQFHGEPILSHKMLEYDNSIVNMFMKIFEPAIALDNKVFVSLEGDLTSLNPDADSKYIRYQRLFNSVNQSLMNVNADLISIYAITHEGNEGIEYRALMPQGEFVIIYRLFIKNNRIYSHGVITSKGKEENKMSKDFFNSFKILD